MKVVRPSFREGIEWRKLTDEERRNTDGTLKPWKYILLRDVFIEVETGLKEHYDCYSDETIYMALLPHGITMKKGYAWNGNTGAPERVRWFDFLRWLWIWICMLLGSLPHDGLFQFSGAIGFPRSVITLSWANSLYYALSDKRVAWIYRTGLFIGSWALWGQRHEGEYVECRPLNQPEPT